MSRTRAPWKFGDLSPASENGQDALGRTLRLLYNDDRVAEQLEKAGCGTTEQNIDALKSPDDHSLASAIGHFVWDSKPGDPKIAGLLVASMQSQAGLQFGDPAGDNLVAIGNGTSHVIHALDPLRVISLEPGEGGRLDTAEKPFPLAED